MTKQYNETDSANADILPNQLPVIPLRDTIVYPFTLYPVLVGRDMSLASLNFALEGDGYVVLLAQQDPLDEEPKLKALHEIGTLAKIVHVLNLPNNTMKVLVNGVSSVVVKKQLQTTQKELLLIEVKPHEISNKRLTKKLKALMSKTIERFTRYVYLNEDHPDESVSAIDSIEDRQHLLYYIASFLDLNLENRQELLSIDDLQLKYTRLLTLLTTELDMYSVSMQINEKVQEEIHTNQKRFFIQEQIKLLQEELGEDEFGDPDLQKIKDAIDKLELPEQAQEKATEELERLKKVPQMSPEYSVSRNYLDWLISLPWGKFTKDNLDITSVEDTLNKDHFGLDKPKERILEHIAVLNLVNSIKGQILCFVGPPGSGKTSLAKSIAGALGRNMVRISLGGIHDEAEIRGHRKTYIGSMPGRIVQALKRAGSMNPVIILDEIDKIGSDYRGDPSSAILEVLDPEQNNTFNDHYMEIDIDLSKTMFITTANVASQIQPALLDRMEIIRLPGYLEHDKLEIAKQHLIPKQCELHGLPSSKINYKDEAIYEIIRNYTAEAGVRNLEKRIAAISRKIARDIVERKSKGSTFNQITINKKKIREFLGVEKYHDKNLDKMDKIGSIRGLAWTSIGGSILQIEVASMPGKNKFILTGQLGDVMKESAQAALSYIRSHSELYAIPPDYFDKHEIHIHIPEGAIPKDGPSAGMAMALAMISLLTQTPIRHDIALTGETTLRGDVYAIGGLNEKLLAAQRNKIKKVIIPHDNLKDLEEIPDKVKDGLEIIPVNTIKEAEAHIFVKSKKRD